MNRSSRRLNPFRIRVYFSFPKEGNYMIKVIKRVWLPRTLKALAPWFANFNLKFALFAVGLGLLDFVTQVERDNATVQWLNAAQEAFDANEKGFNKFRDESLYADKGDAAPVAPVTALPTSPASFQTAIIERLTELVAKIEAADSYTEDIGAQLGIIVPKGEGISSASVHPSVKCFPAQGGYDFALVLAGRGEATMANIEVRFAGSEEWQTIKSFTGKSANVTITPPVAGQAVQIQVRVQLYKNNEKYGQPSDIVYVTVNP
jgi:hypothetical protein